MSSNSKGDVLSIGEVFVVGDSLTGKPIKNRRQITVNKATPLLLDIQSLLGNIVGSIVVFV